MIQMCHRIRRGLNLFRKDLLFLNFRWLPKQERSTWKAKKGKKYRDREIGRGTQGSTTGGNVYVTKSFMFRGLEFLESIRWTALEVLFKCPSRDHVNKSLLEQKHPLKRKRRLEINGDPNKYYFYNFVIVVATFFLISFVVCIFIVVFGLLISVIRLANKFFAKIQGNMFSH